MVKPKLNKKYEHPSNCAHMTPLDTTESNGLSMSNETCLSPWYGTDLTPMRGAKQRDKTCMICNMQKFDKFYASLLIVWDTWLHIYAHLTFFS